MYTKTLSKCFLKIHVGSEVVKLIFWGSERGWLVYGV